MNVQARRYRHGCKLGFSIAAVLFAAAAHSQSIPNQSENRFEYGSRLGQEELPPGNTFEPRVDAALQYADNTSLSSSGGGGALGLEISPGIYAGFNAPRFKGAVDYSLIGRLWDDGSLDDVTHALEANGHWAAIRDIVAFDGQASYGDTVVDYAQGNNYGGLGVFNTGNLAEQAAFSLGPTIQKRFKDFLFDASYTYGRVWYLDKGKGSSTASFGSFATDDSEDQSARVSFGLVPEGGRAYGSAFYSWEHSEFESALPYQFERAGFDGGFELTRTLSVVGDVGKESQLDENASEGGLDSDFWSAGLRWVPHSRTSAEVRYGDRFFGDSFSAEISHTARFVEFSASYEDSPQVDTRRRSLGEFTPGELPPDFDASLGYSAFNSSPYIGKIANVSVSTKGNRTTLSLTGSYNDRDYIDALLGDEEGMGIAFMGTRQLASNVSIDVEAHYMDVQRDASPLPPPFEPILASHDYDTEFIVRGNREFGPRLLASLEAGYFNRGGTSAYDGWWVGLRGRWFPDFAR